jgi:hypothetical protein
MTTRRFYCMKCRKEGNLLNVYQEGYWEDERPKFYGTCEDCGRKCLAPFAPKDDTVRKEATQSEKNIAELHSRALQAARDTRETESSCPRCGGYIRPPIGDGLEVEVSCINCGYSGVTLEVPAGYSLTKSKAVK